MKQESNNSKKPFYSREMKLDATFRKQNKKKPRNVRLFKEVMNKQRKKKLCFKCSLPNHMANFYR